MTAVLESTLAEIRSGPTGETIAAFIDVDGRIIRATTALLHDVWRLVTAHQRQGHVVVLTSSATDARPDVLATELRVGRFLSGPDKAEAVRDFADAHGVDLLASYAYAHSPEDLDLLSVVGHPHPVNPGASLTAVATRRRWRVLQLEKRTRRFDVAPVARTAAMWTGFFASVSAGIGLGLLNRNRRQGIDVATSLWGQLGPALGDVRFNVQGTEHLWSHRPAVFVFNHQSSVLDLLTAVRLLEREFTFVAKKEVGQLPVFGPLFALADVAFVDRSDAAKAIEALKPVVQKLRSGISVAISPEGTRSVTPAVGPFKKGAFRLAMEAQVAVVPVVVRNTGELMWRDSQIARRGVVDVIVHQPISVSDWTVDQLDERIAGVRQLYIDTLEEWPA